MFTRLFSRTAYFPPLPIYHVWLGSVIREAHLARLLQWQQLNSASNITLIVEARFVEEISQQLRDTQITVKPYASLELSEKIILLVDKLIAPRNDELPPNYAAVSDIFRFLLLLEAGLYADLDVTPFNMKTIKINPDLKFQCNGGRVGMKIKNLSGRVLIALHGNALISKAVELIEMLSDTITDEHLQLIRSRTASTRLYATMDTTGFILRAALGKLRINGEKIINLSSSYGVADKKVYDTLVARFESTLEQAWILKNASTMEALDGIKLDEKYRKLISSTVYGKQWQRYPQPSILTLQKSIYQNVKSIELKPESKLRSSL